MGVEWSSLGCGKVEKRRPEFRADKITVDPVTGERLEIFPWWKRWLKILATLPALSVYAVVLGVAITGIYSIEVFIEEIYKGPFKTFLVSC